MAVYAEVQPNETKEGFLQGKQKEKRHSSRWEAGDQKRLYMLSNLMESAFFSRLIHQEQNARNICVYGIYNIAASKSRSLPLSCVSEGMFRHYSCLSMLSVNLRSNEILEIF